MPFAGILEILKPFLRGAVRHPKEALFQKGLMIFNMATGYYSIALDHFADHPHHLPSGSA
jgi:hypothetical protein